MNQTQRELRAEHKKKFILYLVLSLVCMAVFLSLIIPSFFFPTSHGLFWTLVALSLIPFAGVIVFGKLFTSHSREMQNIDYASKK